MKVAVTSALLIGLVGVACYFDIRERRIPNLLTFPMMALGLTVNGALGGLEGLGRAALGLVGGGLILFVPFVFDWTKGGDVKFGAAIGAVKGWPFVGWAILFGALWGGALGAFFLLRRRMLKRATQKAVGFLLAAILLKETKFAANPKSGYLPYGVAIALGAITVLIFELWRGKPCPWW